MKPSTDVPTDVLIQVSPLDYESKLRLGIRVLYAQPRHSLAQRLWDAVVGKVCLYVLNYPNRPIDPHIVARGLEAELSALKDARKRRNAQGVGGDELVQESAENGAAGIGKIDGSGSLHGGLPRAYSHSATMTPEQCAVFSTTAEGVLPKPNSVDDGHHFRFTIDDDRASPAAPDRSPA